MDKLEALWQLRSAVAGIARLVSRDSATLDDFAERHRAMSSSPEARKELQAALPALRRLRESCERAIAEIERWPLDR